MRVSETVFADVVVVVVRAVTLRLLFVVRADVRVAFFVAEFFGIKIVTGLVVRADTFVRSGVRDVNERVVRAVVVFARDTVFSPRTAASAPDMQNRHAQIKSKNFFISR